MLNCCSAVGEAEAGNGKLPFQRKLSEMGRTGLEQPTKTLEETASADQRGTESGTVPKSPMTASFSAADLPPDLAELLNAWANLPPVIRGGILAMVRAARDPS